MMSVARRLGYTYVTESDWPIFTVVVTLVAFVLGMTPQGVQFCENLSAYLFAGKPAPVEAASAPSPSRPDVLFIGNNPSDEWDISATLAPRGYKLLLAGTAEAGIHQLRSNSRDIGLVLIDPRLPGTQAMPQLALKASPGARVFVLGPAHTRAELVSLLLENI